MPSSVSLRPVSVNECPSRFSRAQSQRAGVADRRPERDLRCGIENPKRADPERQAGRQLVCAAATQIQFAGAADRAA